MLWFYNVQVFLILSDPLLINQLGFLILTGDSSLSFLSALDSTDRSDSISSETHRRTSSRGSIRGFLPPEEPLSFFKFVLASIGIASTFFGYFSYRLRSKERETHSEGATSIISTTEGTVLGSHSQKVRCVKYRKQIRITINIGFAIKSMHV